VSHLSTTLHVDASPEIVFDLIADPARGPEWQKMLVELGEISGRPGGVGSSYTGYYHVAGRRIQGRFVVTAAERPRIYQAAGTARGGWTRWTTFIEPADGASDIRVSLEYELPGEIVGSLLGMLTGSRLQAAFIKTYAELKRVAEADAARLASTARPAVGSAGSAA
jgi:ribosome-associated toxin RatA of RatAB toxin-antitoxin module